MRVKSLKSGMLLRSVGDFAPRVEYEKCEQNGKVYTKIKTMRFVYAPLFQGSNLLSKPDGIFIYLGSNKDPYKWDGIYKHHRVLYNGAILHLSGYDVRYVEPAASWFSCTS